MFSLFHPKIVLACLILSAARTSCTQSDNGSCVSLQPKTMARAQFLLQRRTLYCQLREIKVMIHNSTTIFSSMTAITEYCTQLTKPVRYLPSNIYAIKKRFKNVLKFFHDSITISLTEIIMHIALIIVWNVNYSAIKEYQ